MIHLAYLGHSRSYHVEKWLPALAEQGLRVTLISYVPPITEMPGVDVRILDRPFKWLPSNGRSTANDLGARSPNGVRIWHFWGSAEPLRELLDGIGVDVLMASYATNYGWLGTRSGFRPLIAQTWTADITIYPWRGWKQWIFRPMVRRFLRAADVITTDGRGLAEVAARLYPECADKMVPVRWGIRLANYEFDSSIRSRKRKEMGIPEDAPVLTSARGVLDWFRPAEVLNAFLRLLRERSDLHAVFLTLKRDRDERVQGLLDELDRHERGHVIDRFLTTPEMREIWSITDALVSVARDDGISEGILEGMYCGCIPILSDIPSNRSILEDGGKGVIVEGDCDSLDDLAATFGMVVDRLPALQAEMVEQNRIWIRERASIESTAAQVSGIVRRLAIQNS